MGHTHVFGGARGEAPSLNRLASARSSTTGLSWSYDAFGNRKQQTATEGSAPQPEVTFSTGTNRMDGYCHDANGNVLDGNLNTYTWDPNWGAMASVNTGSTTVTANRGGTLRIDSRIMQAASFPKMRRELLL
jgi:YD repeat-containing protein